jgi:hypothetical protein
LLATMPRLPDAGCFRQLKTVSVRSRQSMGHEVVAVPTVAGGMNNIQLHENGSLTGAACWRADGTPIGLAGGWRVRGPIWAGVIGCVIPDERPLNPQDSGRLPVGTPVVLPVDYCTNLHG